MKKNIVTLHSLLCCFLFSALLVSCGNKELSDANYNLLETEKILKEYANFHNNGLDYMKSDVQSPNVRCTQETLMASLGKYVADVYGKDDANKIIQTITPIEEDFFSGKVPGQTKRKSGIRSNISNSLAIEAANECLNNIELRLNKIKEDSILDNKSLLGELHAIIISTYNNYVKLCASELDKQELSQALGVLYGSIEYWTTSSNIKAWSAIRGEKEEHESGKRLTIRKNNSNDDNKGDNKGGDKDKNKDEEKSDKELSTAEYIMVLAAADTLGTALGAGVASGPAAVAASAAAAIYFEPKKTN